MCVCVRVCVRERETERETERERNRERKREIEETSKRGHSTTRLILLISILLYPPMIDINPHRSQTAPTLLSVQVKIAGAYQEIKR